METMGTAGQDSTDASGPSAPVVHSHFKLIVVFFVYAPRRCCVAAATAIIRSPNIVGRSHSSYLIVLTYMLVPKLE